MVPANVGRWLGHGEMEGHAWPCQPQPHFWESEWREKSPATFSEPPKLGQASVQESSSQQEEPLSTHRIQMEKFQKMSVFSGAMSTCPCFHGWSPQRKSAIDIIHGTWKKWVSVPQQIQTQLCLLAGFIKRKMGGTVNRDTQIALAWCGSLWNRSESWNPQCGNRWGSWPEWKVRVCPTCGDLREIGCVTKLSPWYRPGPNDSQRSQITKSWAEQIRNFCNLNKTLKAVEHVVLVCCCSYCFLFFFWCLWTQSHNQVFS